MSFRDPKLLDLGHPRPTVSRNCPYLGAVSVYCGETKLTAVVLLYHASVVFIEPVFDLIDLVDGEVVPRHDGHL
jgi:hypothetical protein